MSTQLETDDHSGMRLLESWATLLYIIHIPILGLVVVVLSRAHSHSSVNSGVVGLASSDYYYYYDEEQEQAEQAQ